MIERRSSRAMGTIIRTTTTRRSEPIQDWCLNPRHWIYHGGNIFSASGGDTICALTQDLAS
jgi:hypothetical protein